VRGSDRRRRRDDGHPCARRPRGPLDVARAEEITGVVRATEVAPGPVEILVDNAGRCPGVLA